MSNNTSNQQPATVDFRKAKIYIAGHGGLVGSAIWRALEKIGCTNLIGRSHLELDLRDQAAVQAFFETEKPEYVVLAAAKVGGIQANDTYRADFFYENLMIEANVIHAAYQHGVKKLLFLGSSCIYPKLAPQPLKEEYLLTAPLEPTNEPYALAKIAGIRLCDAYNRQYGTNFICAMPTNLYGPSDNYHPENSHVLPALIRRIHLAKLLEIEDWGGLERIYQCELLNTGCQASGSMESTNEQPSTEQLLQWLSDSGIQQLSTPNSKLQTTVTCWGSGTPLREFLYSDDLAAACVFMLEKVNYRDVAFTDESGTVQCHLNVGSGEEISIRDLAELIRDVVGFEGEILFDSTKPDGTPRKLMDSSRINKMGWCPDVSLREGIIKAYNGYGSDVGHWFFQSREGA